MENHVNVIEVVRLSSEATIPVQVNDSHAGWDLYSACDCVLLPNSRLLVPTDIAISIPRGCYGRVAPRSGLAVRHGIDIGAGVIDSDFRGNVFVLMINSASTEFRVDKGMRIAQLIIEKYQICYMKLDDKLSDTSRGASGVGFTDTSRGASGVGSKRFY